MKVDTYPIYDKNGKPDYFKLALMLVVVILAILLIRSCNKDLPVKPVVITGKEVHDTLVKIDEQAKRIRDSFMVVLNRKYRDDDANYQAYLKLLNENAVLLNQNEMLSAPVPDTCAKLQAGWISKFNQIKVASDRKDNAANTTIKGLQSTVQTQKKFLSSKDTTINKYRGIADTCSKALSELEKYAKKIKPKREISIGISGMTNYINLKPAIGLGIGYRTRKGLQFDANVYSNQTITVGVKKSLIKF